MKEKMRSKADFLYAITQSYTVRFAKKASKLECGHVYCYKHVTIGG